jgi:outer membrane receptor for ferrienterochelin and colicin
VAAALAGATAPRGPALAAAAEATAGALQEVVVTARKREENLQDVPVSIDVFTQKEMQNLGITSFDDYVTKVPSMSYISIGPGTQIFFMRGVSDGINPNYANTSATGFFVDDMSVSWYGVQPDLHIYDMERIEVLNGPQGTTFGAGAMAGAVRYITNKPDVHAFSAGIDFDGGQIQGGGQNWTYEGFVNVPLIDGVLGLRASAFSVSHGGFIDNALTTRTWKNGTISNSRLGTQRLQPRARGRRPHRPEGRAGRSLECHAHLQLPAPERARRLGSGSGDAADGVALRSGIARPRSQAARPARGRRRRHRRPGVREHLLVTADPAAE